MSLEIHMTAEMGAEGHLETVERVMTLANKYGHAVLLTTVGNDYYEPLPDGYDLPEVSFNGGLPVGGRSLDEALSSGALERYIQKRS